MLRLESRRVDEQDTARPAPSRIPVTRWRVVCAFFDVMLTRSPTRRLSSVDLPTFGRPAIAT